MYRNTFPSLTQLSAKLSPEDNVLPYTVRVCLLAVRSKFHLAAAEPHLQRRNHGRSVSWTSEFVQEIRRGFRVCRVVICFIVFYLCFNQTLNNIISQANQMELNGVPNDTVQALNAIFYIVLNPIIQGGVLKFLSLRRISSGPITRMTTAFLITAAAMAYAAGIQQLIYSRGPCFAHPKACEAGIVDRDGPLTRYRSNEVSVWIQIPFHILIATGEIFGSVALNEFAYAEAPTSMKALVKAFEQFTAALGAILGIALGPLLQDPLLVTMYSCLAATMGLSGILVVRYFMVKAIIVAAFNIRAFILSAVGFRSAPRQRCTRDSRLHSPPLASIYSAPRARHTPRPSQAPTPLRSGRLSQCKLQVSIHHGILLKLFGPAASASSSMC